MTLLRHEKTLGDYFKESKLFGIVFTVLFFYYCLLIPIETANGFFIYKNIDALNKMIVAGKLFISILSLAFLAITSRNVFLKFLVPIITAFLLVFIHQVSSSGDDLRSINIIFKIFNNFFAVYFIFFLLKFGPLGFNKVVTIVTTNFCFLVFNILLGGLGIGFANYTSADETAIGGTGYLFAGNEVGVTLLLAYGAMLLVYCHRPKITLLITFTAIFAAILVLSKATLIGILIASLFLIYFINRTLAVIIGGTTIFLALTTYSYWISFFQLAINRWTYLINSYGIEAFLLGGHKRVTYIQNYLNFVEQNPLYLLVGLGWTGEPENNLFDLIEAFGVFGMVIFVIFTVSLISPTKYFFTNFKYTFANAAFKSSIIISFLVLGIAILAGHTIQSTLIGPFFGLICLSHYLFGLKKTN